VGTAALLLMLPLAATSFNRAIKALGAARWQRLHQAVYAIGCWGCCTSSGCARGKNDFGEWSVYAAIVALLLGWRVWAWRARRPPAATS
jgi:sulfoxide reductase heme-binding subunit YedZ